MGECPIILVFRFLMPVGGPTLVKGTAAGDDTVRSREVDRGTGARALEDPGTCAVLGAGLLREICGNLGEKLEGVWEGQAAVEAHRAFCGSLGDDCSPLGSVD